MAENTNKITTAEKANDFKSDPLGVVFRAFTIVGIIGAAIFTIGQLLITLGSGSEWQTQAGLLLIAFCWLMGFLFVYWILTLFSRIYFTLNSIDEKMSKIITATPEKSDTVGTAEVKPATEKTE